MACTILYVEDDEGVRESTHSILAAAGFQMLVAKNAEEALRLLSEHKVDVLFTDIVMPGMNGTDLARVVRERYPQTKIMLTTGYYSRAAEGEQAGVLLFKPAREDQIVAELMKLLAAAPRSDCLFI